MCKKEGKRNVERISLALTVLYLLVDLCPQLLQFGLKRPNLLQESLGGKGKGIESIIFVQKGLKKQ